MENYLANAEAICSVDAAVDVIGHLNNKGEIYSH